MCRIDKNIRHFLEDQRNQRTPLVLLPKHAASVGQTLGLVKAPKATWVKAHCAVGVNLVSVYCHLSQIWPGSDNDWSFRLIHYPSSIEEAEVVSNERLQ
jgi:hypothetical protein